MLQGDPSNLSPQKIEYSPDNTNKSRMAQNYNNNYNMPQYGMNPFSLDHFNNNDYYNNNIHFNNMQYLIQNQESLSSPLINTKNSSINNNIINNDTNDNKNNIKEIKEDEVEDLT